MFKEPHELLLGVVEVGPSVQTFGQDGALIVYLGCALLTEDLASVILLIVAEVADLPQRTIFRDAPVLGGPRADLLSFEALLGCLSNQDLVGVGLGREGIEELL